MQDMTPRRKAAPLAIAERLRISWRVVKGRARYLRKAVKGTLGECPRECPLCSWTGLFLNFGTPPRFDVVCPRCGSHPRHRLLSLVQQHEILIAPNSEVLHFAPERSLKPMVRAAGLQRYVTADLKDGLDLKLNIERIDLPDGSFDAIICSHVLEHVDDRVALLELRRILRKSGRLILMVPITEGSGKTYENPSVTSWQDRKLHFGGGTHVRYYGRDFRDRVKAAGFELHEYCADDYEPIRHGLVRGERVFVGLKPAA
jgi:SAM-dependent methyltransferase